MANFEPAKCSPDASWNTGRFIDNYNWAMENYQELVEKHGSSRYVAIRDRKVVGETFSMDKDKRVKLVSALQVRYPIDCESICIIPL
jgi:hypothetical protein